MIVSSSVGTILIITNMVFTFVRPSKIEEENDQEVKGIKIRKPPSVIAIIMAITTNITILPFLIGHLVIMSGN